MFTIACGQWPTANLDRAADGGAECKPPLMHHPPAPMPHPRPRTCLAPTRARAPPGLAPRARLSCRHCIAFRVGGGYLTKGYGEHCANCGNKIDIDLGRLDGFTKDVIEDVAADEAEKPKWESKKWEPNKDQKRLVKQG